ncbi:TetR/AcrR family transcriptional regulator [Clostridium sp. JNZ X4-2]
MKRKNITTHMMKEYISKSLLILMAEKDFTSISINEITDKAGVNRSTYYRNFSSKEDILKFYFSNIMQDYLSDYKNSKKYSFENYMLTLFKHFHKYKEELLLIYKNGLAYLILDVLNYQFEQSRTGKNISIEEQYKLYFHTGGIYNFYILWFSHEMKETPEELTKIALSLFLDSAKPLLLALE